MEKVEKHCYRGLGGRGTTSHHFNLKKLTAELHRILVEVYGNSALSETAMVSDNALHP